MHIVEKLIAERATRLMSRKRLFSLIRPLLYRSLNYDAAVEMADNIVDKPGYEAFQYVSDILAANTKTSGLDNIPKEGKCLIIANHPTGLADGLAVFDAIKTRRPDHIFLANADAMRVVPKADDIIIPVEWVKDKRSQLKTKQTLINIRTAIKDERAIVIFPAGRLAKLEITGLIDKGWESSAAMIARKYDVPIIPLNIKARNSMMYYLLSWISTELRDITLFHELLNKKGKTFKLMFNPAIDPKTLPKNADEATAKIRKIVETM